MWSHYSRRQCLTSVARQIKICCLFHEMNERAVCFLSVPFKFGKREVDPAVAEVHVSCFLSSHHTLSFTAQDLLCFLKRCEWRHFLRLSHGDQRTRDQCWSSLMIHLPGFLLKEFLVDGPVTHLYPNTS